MGGCSIIVCPNFTFGANYNGCNLPFRMLPAKFSQSYGINMYSISADVGISMSSTVVIYKYLFEYIEKCI
ncbi:hypothetical protein psyc5s11_49200 [Clostridium gelidum]|uniref:Uncharacterized protein n=1 Tax=Clostridium gelidum TaxID=704125 RepID=A0ABM7TC36_9CLOT|nr:hypothetical protein psyc5s11_49200 [Clostridium gelidum]